MNKKELMIRNFTQVPYKYIRGESKLEKEKLLLMTLILINKDVKGKYIFNIKWLCEILNTTTDNTTRVKFIKDTLKEFQENNVFCFSEDIFGSNRLDKIDNRSIIFGKMQDELYQFTSIYDIDIINIINYCHDNNIDKSGLLYLYIYISSCINEDHNNENYKLCYPSIETLETQTELSRNTILKYRQILKELNIINYDYLGYDIVGMEFKSTNTYYCRMEDTDKLQERMKVLSCSAHLQKLSKTDKIKINEKRSIKQKINNLKRKQTLKQHESEILTELELKYQSLCNDN